MADSTRFKLHCFYGYIIQGRDHPCQCKSPKYNVYTAEILYTKHQCPAPFCIELMPIVGYNIFGYFSSRKRRRYVLNKKILFVLLCIVSLICTGCFSGSANLTIDESGEVHSTFSMAGMDFMKEEIEKQKQELLKDHPNAIITPIHDGPLNGFSIQIDYENMDRFAADGLKFYATRPNVCKGIQKQGRWFFDAYALDLLLEGDKRPAQLQGNDAAALAQAFLSQVRFDFTLNLPYEPDSNNADTVSNGNKSLGWNLIATLIQGDAKRISATFRLWNKMHIALTIGIAILLAAVTVLFAVQATSAEGNEKRTKTGIAIGAGVSLLLLSLISAYLILAPVKFTDNDIISVTLPQETKQNETPGGTQTTSQLPPQPKPQQQNRQPAQKPPVQAPRQNNTATNKKQSEQGTPAQTLQAFHKNITDKNYRKAYDCLSQNYQNAVTYEGWAPGFSTTVSSTVSDIKTESQTEDQAVLTYILKAVDNPGGTQRFRGTAVLVRTPNGWKIDEITNKTM